MNKSKTPFVDRKRGFVFLTLNKARENMGKYKRILLRLTMKNGLEIDALVTKEISSATAWAIRVVAITVLLYGVARLITVVRWW
ncbi:hypothetical protein V5268_005289 [Escherichia coli]